MTKLLTAACVFVRVCVDPVPVRQRPLSAVSMLPQWKQLHGDSSHLRLLPAAGSGHRLYNVDAWHGGAAEKGMQDSSYKIHARNNRSGFIDIV